ncbi:phage baseplate assembly protein V [Methylobacterium hispanicum]|uniref:phage baseplate assembly protein V n=1 Tax=Methylobacterium hispanicum TaxID=270350 RepID=UPI002F33F148
MSDPFTDLVEMLRKELSDLRTKQDDYDRRLNNMFREARVTKVHAEEGMAEVEADGLPSHKIPWVTRAGTQKEWDPPTEGERVMLFSPTGEPGLGMIMHGGYSSQFPQNHNKAGEHRRSVGDKVSTTTTGEDKVSKTENVTVSQNADSHGIAAGEKSKHVVEAGKITNDTPQMLATRDVHLATG